MTDRQLPLFEEGEMPPPAVVARGRRGRALVPTKVVDVTPVRIEPPPKPAPAQHVENSTTTTELSALVITREVEVETTGDGRRRKRSHTHIRWLSHRRTIAWVVALGAASGVGVMAHAWWPEIASRISAWRSPPPIVQPPLVQPPPVMPPKRAPRHARRTESWWTF